MQSAEMRDSFMSLTLSCGLRMYFCLPGAIRTRGIEFRKLAVCPLAYGEIVSSRGVAPLCPFERYVLSVVRLLFRHDDVLFLFCPALIPDFHEDAAQPIFTRPLANAPKLVIPRVSFNEWDVFSRKQH